MESEREWRCTQCGKLLGRTKGDRLHVRFARGHEYLVGLPATCACRYCGTLNELRFLQDDGVKEGMHPPRS
jgi:hypothetical protein